MTDTPHDSPKRRWPWIVLLICFFLGCAIGSYFYIVSSRGESELRAAEMEAARNDPAWRLEDMEAARPKLSDERNLAVPLQAANKLLPADWPKPELDNIFDSENPARVLSEEQAALLVQELERARPALAAAVQCDGLEAARFPVPYDVNWTNTSLDVLGDVRRIVRLFSIDAIARAMNKDSDGALAAGARCLLVSRALQDQPILIAFLVQNACKIQSARAMQRTLGLTEPSEAALAALQEQLQRAEAEPDWLIAVRGERAAEERAIRAMRNGEMFGGAMQPLAARLLDGLMGGFAGTAPASNHAAVIRAGTQLVEIAKLPLEQQPESMARVIAQMRAGPMLLRLVAPAVDKAFDSNLRVRAELRCAIVAVAAERFRLATGKWPEKLDELVPRFLKSVPIDPFGTGLLHLANRADGIVIYSVGKDGKDDGGNLIVDSQAAGTDLGTRLFDAAKRRQPAKAPEPPK